jgi:arylsulfatase A-like enzyme
MRRRDFVRAGLGALGAVARAQKPPPNLIFLLSDDHRADSLGCIGNPIVRTPHLDRMAAEGVVFTNHFVTTSICMTSRASIFSGQYARTHGIEDFSRAFTEAQFARTYPALLRAAGYHIGFIGKYGVGDVMPESKFVYWRGFPGQGRYFQERGGRPVHLTELMGDQSLEFLRSAPAGKPFCLSVSFKAPHVQDEDPRQMIYDPAHRDWYARDVIPVPKTADPRYIRMLPVEVQRSEGRRRWAALFGTPELFQESVKGYYRLITEVDLAVGRIRAELARTGAASNTILVFTGDNGFYLGEHGLSHKWLMHEESIRTPLLVFDPRLPSSHRGKRRAEMTLNIDLAPTLLRWARLEPPASMQGRALQPLVEGATPAWRKDWFYEHHFTNGGWIPQTEGVRTEDWKYTRYLDTEPVFEELFDLRRDPLEERNLAPERAHAAKLAELRGSWKDWSARLAAAGATSASGRRASAGKYPGSDGFPCG